MKAQFRALVLVVFALCLGACGFHLRGVANLPFKTLAISLPDVNTLRDALARSVTAGSDTKVVSQGEAAEAILDVTGDVITKNVLALNTSGQIREYEIVRTFSFRLHNGKGIELLPPGSIILRRNVSFNDNQLLAKQQEETLLLHDMQNDLVQQLLRRLASAKPEGIKD